MENLTLGDGSKIAIIGGGPAGPSKKIRIILGSMFTGTIPYKNIFLMALDFRLQLNLIFNTMRYSCAD